MEKSINTKVIVVSVIVAVFAVVTPMVMFTGKAPSPISMPVQTVVHAPVPMKTVLPLVPVLNEIKFDGVADDDLAGQRQGKTALTNLFLDSCSNFADMELAHLQEQKQLQPLGLNESQITDAVRVYLQELTQLQNLNLHGGVITDAGLKYLQGLKQLQSLDLGGFQITDIGMVYLNGLTVSFPANPHIS